MDDHMGSDTPKKGRWQHQLHTWARQSLVRELWEWVRCKDVTLPNVRQLAESIAELPTSAVDGVVHGSEWCWKNDDRQSVHAEFQAAEFQDNPRESAKRRSARRRVLKQPFEIGYQPEGPLTAARSIACRMAYRKILLVG